MTPRILLRKRNGFVYLTFDDGPNPEVTPALLELLAKHDIKATFFLIGQKMKQHPDIVARIADSGHSIGNHSYSHPRMIFMSREKMHSEIDQTHDLISEIIGRQPSLFRPPHGQFGPRLLRALRHRNYMLVFWNASTRDYKKSASQEFIQTRLGYAVRPGNIVLMHDGHRNGQLTLLALKRTLGRLKEKGFKFESLR